MSKVKAEVKVKAYIRSKTRRSDWKACVGLQFLINKLQDERPVYLDGFGSTYLMKIDKNAYLINHSFYSQDGEPTTISLDELRWFFRKEEVLFKDIASSLRGSRNTGSSRLSNYDSYEAYLEYRHEYRSFEYESDVIVDKSTKVRVSRDVMLALLLAKREILSIVVSLKAYVGMVQLLCNVSINHLVYWYLPVVYYVRRLYFLSGRRELPVIV